MREPSARTWMTRPRIAGIGDDQVTPPPEHEMRQAAGPGEADEGPQLVGVVDRGEQVGRSADAHRREPGERLVARCLDPDPALDVGPGRDGVEARAIIAAPPRARRSISAGFGNGRRARRSHDQLGDRGGRTRSPQAARGGRHRGVRLRILEQAAASRSAAASNSSSAISRAAPASTRLAAFARWCPAACGYGTTTIGRPSAVTSARVDDPARPMTRSAVASAASISSRRNGYGR